MIINLKFTTLWLPLLVTIFLLSSCRTTDGLQKEPGQKSLKKSIEESIIFKEGFTGFVLFDPVSQKTIYSKNSVHYFTPASNTKILTLYTAMKILGEREEALKYSTTNEGGLYIQGTGHPGLLNSTLITEEENALFQFLKQNQKTVTFCTCNFQDKRYGAGWSWDDYHYAFQKEKSPLPIYGNSAIFSKRSREDTISFYPPYFKNHSSLTIDSTISRPAISRNWDDNHFSLKTPSNKTFTNIERPFRTDITTISALLSDTLNQQIYSCDGMCPKRNYKGVLSNIPTEVLYQQLLQPSDNFIAEQLLLLCANQLFDTLSVERTIEWALDSLFNKLSYQPKWVDGSGLSRYNMLTPLSIVEVLNQLYIEYPEKHLFPLFPAGGQSGTIKDWYGGLEQPYVFAKTGTLRYLHCLSGYIVTRSNRRLIFSFMHNNYTGSLSALKREMERVLQLIYAEF